MDYVRVEREDDIAVLTIDRQEKLNALDPQVTEEIGQALLELEAEGPRAIIVTGAGERSFVAGADISAMSSMSPLEAKRFSEIGHAAMALLDRSPIPTIAAVNGYALGGGCEVAIACDVRIAAENATFGFPEVTLGILPGMGGTQRLPHLVGPAFAKELIFTGRRIDAAEAKDLGIVTEVVERAELDATATRLAARLCESSPVALRSAKAAIGAALGPLGAGIRREDEEWAKVIASADRREGIEAFNDKRPPRWSNR